MSSYAGALFQAAGSSKAQETCLAELQTVVEVATSDAQFGQFLRNPTIQRSAKAATIGDVMSAGKFSGPTSMFFKVLAENGRMAEVGKIADKYAELIHASNGEVMATVTTAEVRLLQCRCCS